MKRIYKRVSKDEYYQKIGFYFHHDFLQKINYIKNEMVIMDIISRCMLTGKEKKIAYCKVKQCDYAGKHPIKYYVLKDQL